MEPRTRERGDESVGDALSGNKFEATLAHTGLSDDEPQPPAPSRLAVRHLTKSYGSRPAVADVTFELANGVTALLGPNGAGKSTIIKCVVGILDWDDGQILVNDVDADRNPRAARSGLGYMPERAAFPPEMTVRSYLDHAARMKGLLRRQRSGIVDRAVDRLDLGAVAGRVIGNLSKGYRQRVGLAQAILGDPPVLVLDEPMAGLDPLHVWDLRDVLWEYGREHCVMLSTHVLPEARVLCERILVIAGGRLVFDGGLVEAELTSSVTRRWRVGVRCSDVEALQRLVAGVGISVVHTRTAGSGISLVVDADSADQIDALAAAVLAQGWSLAHLEPMTDLIDSAFREAGLQRGTEAGE